jgi:hypothetical protein
MGYNGTMSGPAPIDPTRSTRSEELAPLGGTDEMEDGGRIRRGLRLVGRSWSFLTERPRLIVLPALAALTSVLALLAIELPVLYLVRDQYFSIAIAVGAAAMALSTTFVTVFFNVGFLKMVDAHLRGEEPTVSDGLREARARLPQIAGWTLVSATVGLLLSLLEQLPVFGGWVGRLIDWLAGVAWSLATFFIVPVLAFEGLGPFASIRRSAGVFRQRWGESLTGGIAIGAVTGFLILPGLGLFFASLAAFQEHSYVLGLALGAGGAALAAPAIAFTSALTEMFRFFLYREATTGAVEGPFSRDELLSSVERKKRRWSLLRGDS